MRRFAAIRGFIVPRNFSSPLTSTAKHPHIHTALIAVLGLAAVGLPALGASRPSDYKTPPPILLWEFKKAEDASAWLQANPGAQGLSVRKGKLAGNSSNQDVELVSPAIHLDSSPQQVIELRIRTDLDTVLGIGEGEGLVPVSSSSVNPPYQRLTPLPHNRRTQTIRVAPFWPDAPFHGIRITLSHPGAFEIEWIRVIDLTALPEPDTEFPDEAQQLPAHPRPPSPAPGPQWNFAATAEGWTAASGIDDLQQWLGVLRADTGKSSDPLILSPPISLQAGDLPWLTLRLKASKGKDVEFFWAREGQPGTFSILIPLTPSMKQPPSFEEYTFDLSRNREWKGTLSAIGLRLPPDSVVEVDFVRLGPHELPDVVPSAGVRASFVGKTIVRIEINDCGNLSLGFELPAMIRVCRFWP